MHYQPGSILRLVAFHMAGLSVFLVGFSWTALLVLLVTFLARNFALAAGYHRYFSHRSFKATRCFQCFLAVLGCTGGQRGPLSWATSHRRHHAHADRPGDPHSPAVHGFFHAHFGWFLVENPLPTDKELLHRYRSYPEILWLNRYYYVVFLLYLALLFGLGQALALLAPGLYTNGVQFVVYGGVLSTLGLLHSTCLINSVAHGHGKKGAGCDEQESDLSRNVWWLFPCTFGECWHRSHHRYPWSANTGIESRHPDWIYLALKCCARLRLVSRLKNVSS